MENVIQSIETQEEAVKILLEKLTEEATKVRQYYSPNKLSTLASYSEFKNQSDEFKREMFREVIRRFSTSNGYKQYYIIDLWKRMLNAIFRSNLKLSLLDLDLAVEKVARFDSAVAPLFPLKALINRVEKIQSEYGLTNDFVVKLYKAKLKPRSQYEPLNVEARNLNARIDKIQSVHLGRDTEILDRDKFGTEVNEFLMNLTHEELEKWKKLVNTFAKLRAGTKPTKQWIKVANEIIATIGEEQVTKKFTEWVNLGTALYKEGHKTSDPRMLSTLNEAFLRNVVYAASQLNNKTLTDAVDALGLVCLKKLRGVGQICKKLGNACIVTFAMLPFEEGIAKLTKYRSKAKYPSTITLIENKISEVSQREGKTPDEIEEMGVPTLGLEATHELHFPMNEYTGWLSIDSITQVNLVWKRENGKVVKNPPKAVKEAFPAEVKMLKQKAKELKEVMQAQRKRVERFFLKQREWTFENWFSYYIEHPLMGYLGKRLIWHFSNGTQKTTAIFHEGKWFNPHGESTDWIDEKTTVMLWHPIGFEVGYVSAWRDWLMQNEIQQPIKQAFREIYIVTDAELNTRSYSNRFAAHVIRQFQFSALCQARGWRYTLQGAWDSHNTPTRHLSDWDIRVEFWVEADYQGETAATGIFNYVFTDQVRFYRDGVQLNMDEVPALVFSELMRDVDMFVGVTSLGNDPNWQDGGNQRINNYWQNYTQADLTQSAKTRKEVLERVIPRLVIAEKCSFSEKHLIVKGEIRTYKIHLGSGNILMTPNDQYLCIVPDGRNQPKNLFLPFEGDRVLSIILSKAFLLAEDKKITDPTITRQINLKY